MMGHIHNLLLKLVEKELGKPGVSRVFEIAELEQREYRTEVVYPESEFQALYAATRELFAIDDRQAQEAFAEFFMERSPQLFPAIFEVAGSARGLLERVPTIHRQWPSAASAAEFRDKLSLIGSTKSSLVFKYDSPNRLCRVLTRVAELCLQFFDETGEVRELCCTQDGAPHCEVEVEFQGVAS